MRVLIATDSFPPGCGGSGWSTYELARGLRARGHELTLSSRARGSRDGEREYDGFVVREAGVFAPGHPVRAELPEERTALRAPRHGYFAASSADTQAEIIHGQHVMTIPAGGRRG